MYSNTAPAVIEPDAVADSRRANCQLLAKECALSTGKLPRRLAQEQ